jgi:DNA-binding transcriptional regulator LsrR (DeoR family)
MKKNTSDVAPAATAQGRPALESPGRTVQLLEVARQFYLDMESKVTIAERMGISRFAVSRLLDEARASGLVRIDIRPPSEIDFDLSHELVARTTLSRAIVLSASDPDSQMKPLADTAAAYLVETCVDDDVLGLLVSRTTNMILDRINDLPACSIVQLAGVTHSSYFDHNPAATIRAMAARSRGQTYPIYAPMLLDTPQLVAQMRDQIGISDSVAQFAKLTRAMFAIGGWSADTSGLFNIANSEDRAGAKAAGAVAEVVGHLLDGWGQRVFTQLSERCLNIPYQLLARVPDRIAVGGGTARHHAVLACIRARLATTLVTDAETARFVLSHIGSSNSTR